MAKKVTGQVKLQIPAGKATPTPPVGTALGPQGVALVETLKVIGEKNVRITPDVMATGGGSGDAGGGIGSLLLLNLFRDRLNMPSSNGEKVSK